MKVKNEMYVLVEIFAYCHSILPSSQCSWI